MAVQLKRLNLHYEQIPPEIIEAVLNPKVLKKAFNAQFERIAISSFLKREYCIDEIAEALLMDI